MDQSVSDVMTVYPPLTHCVSILKRMYMRECESEGSGVFVLPVVNLDILVGLWVIHEPHQLQMKDWREGKKLHSLFRFLQYKQTSH